MERIRISHLIDHPEHIPELAQWFAQEWGSILPNETIETRTEKLKSHMNRDKLPIAWIAHANGQLLGTAALRIHDLEGREDLTPWLAGVLVGPGFRGRGIGTALCATVENTARSRGTEKLYLFTHDKQGWYSRLGWRVFEPCVWHGLSVVIMCKQLRAA